MCLSPDAYVYQVVYARLRTQGVSVKRAEAVARKVQRSYALKRRESAVLRDATSKSADTRRGIA